MLNPNLCQEVSPTRAWTLLSQLLLFVINHPLVAIALIITFALLPLALSPPQQKLKWKKRSLLCGSIALFLYLLLVTPPLPSVGRYLLARNLPPNSTEPADAIVVLGRGKYQNNLRAKLSADLWRTQRTPLMFASGRTDTPIIVNLWRQAKPPIDSSAIAGEPCSLTTEQNAQFTAALLWPRGIRKIILMTDEPHMRRSQLVFESFGFDVIPHVIPFETKNLARKNFLVIRESLGLLSYGLKDRYSSRPIPPRSIIENSIIEDTENSIIEDSITRVSRTSAFISNSLND